MLVIGSMGSAQQGLSGLDWGVIAVYALGLLAIGWLYSRRTETAEEYLLGGRRMRSFLVGLSLYATMFSTITYLAIPGEMLKHGPVVLCWVLAVPVVYVVVGYGLIPRIVKLPVTSAYELLEGRLGLSTRLTASTIFLAIRLLWMALIIYLTSQKIIVVVMEWPKWTIPYVSATVALVTIVYTSMGGLRAVVLTDAIQFFILFGGAVLSLIVITVSMGSVSAWWPTEWAPHWDEQPIFSWDPHERVTVFGAVVSMTLWRICTFGADQMSIQRYLATRDAKSARRAFLISLLASVAVSCFLAVLGFALLGFWRSHPQTLGTDTGNLADADAIFPKFIVNCLPPVVSGLVVSGLLAAAMSSLSSGVNSSSSVIAADFIDRLRTKPMAEKRRVQLAKLSAFTIGIVSVGLSFLIGQVPGNILEVTMTTNHVFVAPLFCLFLMAMFVPFATPFGAILGAVYGCGAAVLVGFWDQLTAGEPISFQWIVLVSLVVDLLAGCALSLIPTRGKKPALLGLYTVLALAPLVITYVIVV